MNDILYQFILENQDIYISILDQLKSKSGKKKLSYYQFANTKHFNIESLLILSNNDGYIKCKTNHFDEILKILQTKKNLFSIYGDSKTISKIEKLLGFSIRSKINYYLMVLNKDDFIPAAADNDGYVSIECDMRHFEDLKKLQYLYHMEEVYSKTDYYPYKTEMMHFKKMLADRLNYAVYTASCPRKAVSKVYVNAESPNAYQVGGVYTLKEYRKKGLSLFCMTDFIRRAFKDNKEKLILFVKKENNAAVHLYKKLGFKTINETSILYF